MRLKSIQMQGFKSFADKIYLDFNSGVTAIVGPNGSGKSNISDAIRWVMGEQSVKSLRGSRMEDVIFSGTEERSPLGFAEVTLILDNSDGYFELDFPEITVTRRVYRSGEGEYYINKTLCRLKDIHELFMDTGLGRDGYSIIGQGKIDSILSTKSEDRRQIFEEAAGISKYKYRKIEAERKLVQTVDNLTRVQDILAELGSQIDPLSKQAEKAKKYLVLRDELRGLDISVSVINIDKIKEELSTLDGDLGILNSQIDEILKELSDTEAEISQMYDKMREADGEISALSDEERSIAIKISDAEKNVGILKNDTEHNISNIERLEIEINHILESVKLADDELLNHKDRLRELNITNEQITRETDEISESLEGKNADADEKSGALTEVKSEIIAVASEINSIEGAIENYKILLTGFESRKNDINAELENKNRDREALKVRLEEASKAKAEIKEKTQTEEMRLAETEISLKEKKERKTALSESISSHKLELSKKQSRQTMLSDMERDLEGYAKGVKATMTAYKEGKLSKDGIYGPLMQLIKTERKYITAIETALGGAGQNIVTESEEEAKCAIAYLKENHLGRATFLPVSAVRAKKIDNSDAEGQKGYIAVASELVECDAKYREIVDSLLLGTVVCEDIDKAISMAKKAGYKFKIVTLAGEVIQPGGAITGGSAVKTAGSLSRGAEIEKLKNEIEDIKAVSQKEEKESLELSSAIEKEERELSAMAENIQAMRDELVHKTADEEKISALLENADMISSQSENEMAEISARLGEIEAEIADKKKIIEEKTAHRTELEARAIKMSEEYDRIADDNEKLAQKLTELNIRKNAVLKDIELENERMAGITDTKGGYLESVNIKRGGIETLKTRNTSIEEEIEALIKSGEELKQKSVECRENAENLNAERLKTEEKIRIRQNEVKDTQEKKFALSTRASKIESRIEKLTGDREAIINRMWDDYEITYSAALEIKIEGEFDFAAASRRIRLLKEEIKSLGNINIDSIEEYKNVKERFDFLTEQTEDLEKAKAELDSVIAEMMEIMKNRFAEQFMVINESFNRVFSELFGGGKATLYLTDPDNVLESGIEIEAQPPGKKLQSLTLLSGGERAFTAIALLFAILEVRPTPFCILDEIEAALDDVNVYRYADYLKKYSKKTQFIVVTHRRGTMEAANILYGVTMQERGISKLLSLNIDEVKE